MLPAIPTFPRIQTGPKSSVWRPWEISLCSYGCVVSYTSTCSWFFVGCIIVQGPDFIFLSWWIIYYLSFQYFFFVHTNWFYFHLLELRSWWDANGGTFISAYRLILALFPIRGWVMDDSGQRENGRHKSDQYKGVLHSQVTRKFAKRTLSPRCFYILFSSLPSCEL